MTKIIEYIGAAVISALPALVLIGSYMNPAKEPQLRASADPNTMIWSYPEEYQTRNFKDIIPFGSLDEVILRTEEGKVITLKRGDEGFAEQEKIYTNVIIKDYY